MLHWLKKYTELLKSLRLKNKQNIIYTFFYKNHIKAHKITTTDPK